MKNYIILTMLLFSITSVAQNKEKAVPGNPESYIDRFEMKNVSKNRNGWAYYYIPKGMADTLTVKMSCVYEGTQTHPPHVHNENEAFYIVKGPVNFHINGEERILNTGDFIYTPSGSSHNIQRVGSDTIKYLVMKRETIEPISHPYKVGKENYTFDDCSFFLSKKEDWKGNNPVRIVTLDEQFADGFEVAIERITDQKNTIVRSEAENNKQTAIYVVSGEAEVEMNGLPAKIKTDNTFYCPKKQSYTLTKGGEEPLVFISITTR